MVFSDVTGLYYLDRPYIWNDSAFQGFLDTGQIHSVDDLRAALATLGVTHLFIQACDGCERRGFDSLVQDLLAVDGTPVYDNPTGTYPVALVRGIYGSAHVAVYELALGAPRSSTAVCGG